MNYIVGSVLTRIQAYSLLAPNALRCSDLSSASRKEGENLIVIHTFQHPCYKEGYS